ncbi:MAG: DUF1206 domain-containing protein [Propionibacteriaceae bacterium]
MASGTKRDASDEISADTDAVRRSTGYHALVGVGLVSFGIVHLVLAWLAVRVAFGQSGDASQQGALKELSQQPFGLVLLWVMAVGLLVLAVWQVIEAVVVRAGQKSAKRVRRRLSSIGRAVVYLVLSISAARVALGAGSSSGKSEDTVSARLMSVPFGRVLVAIVGVIIISVGVSQIVKGVRRKFTDDLDGVTGQAPLRLGTVGYCAKGVALAIIGGLFGWAALSYDPEKAGGMDAALSTLRGQPFGAVLLTAMAAGLAAFGLYCFYWARHAKY